MNFKTLSFFFISLTCGCGSLWAQHVEYDPQPQATDRATRNAIVLEETLTLHAPFRSCHAATIAQAADGSLVCAYFAGSYEGCFDVCIYTQRQAKDASQWSAPAVLSDGKLSPSRRQACYNPVLFQVPQGELRCYFKIGPYVQGWKGYLCRSADGGQTWAPREALPDSLYGPIKNKPLLHGNTLLSPTSDERGGWRIYFERSTDMGATWKRTAFVDAAQDIQAIQPTILVGAQDRLLAYCRTQSSRIGLTVSNDGGQTWSPLQLTDIPNNNSGIDGVTLSDGTHVLVCNPVGNEDGKRSGPRTPLAVLRSNDGLHWHYWLTLEDAPEGEYSYPSVIQTADTHLHIVYTWRREHIKHVEIIP